MTDFLVPRRQALTGTLALKAGALTDRLDSMVHLWSWNLRRIEAPQAWDITRGDPRAVVAIVDTGIDPDHPDLKGKILPGVNVNSNVDAIDPRDRACWIDDQGHGTAVAGVVASRGWRGKGLAGVAPGCRLVPIKCNSPRTGNVSAENIAAGVRAAVAAGARVLNLSVGVVLGEYGLTTEALLDLKSSIQTALGKGAVVICAAGPGGSEAPYPALWTQEPGFEGLISVGAVTRQNRLSPHSASGDFVTVYAPGDGVVSTTMGCTFAPFGATSAAAPHVSGIAALIRSLNPHATPTQIRGFLESGAKNGMVSALGALRQALPAV